jgi:membrane protein YqaA with SNARE-associated domain
LLVAVSAILGGVLGYLMGQLATMLKGKAAKAAKAA